ncbi:transcriptional regulator [Caulobacter sp. AP07]|uniref:LysR family transcriptional regulator n=1 Tax=Caulobacter sp. AP07 TaxID=1144304 RepID=UPI0002721189|nr:LysR family transcriptional regulator [Caulobacter sp. AP07]EJL27379.1 transcriptional regulator [Caulobacter sp. AP07]
MTLSRNLNRLIYFVTVVDAGSFTAAAERLGLTKAVVSQHIAKLEQEVGATLLLRTSRSLRPTEAGRTFHARCAAILRDSEEAFGELAQAARTPAGMLRLTAPFDYGAAVVAPALAEFVRRYPACEVDLQLSDRTLDMGAARIDMAIHVGWLSDSRLQARRVGSFRQILVCGPAFAQQVRDLQGPEDLAALPFVVNPALPDPRRWRFTDADGVSLVVQVRPSLVVDATPVVHSAARAGAGLAILPDYTVAEDLAQGRLTHVLPAWSLPSGGIDAVFPAARFRPVAANAFANLLAQFEKRRANGSTS